MTINLTILTDIPKLDFLHQIAVPQIIFNYFFKEKV